VISIKKTYRHHIYSIMGTLGFHVLLVGIFLISEMNLKGIIKEKAIYIEFPVEMLEKEALRSETQRSSVAIPSDASSMTNQPSARDPGRVENPLQDRYFDEKYQREIAEAQKLLSDVNKQLAKERISPDEIPMPEDITEGKAREDIRNVVYSGESNVEYKLINRYHLRLPIPVYLAKGGGIVTVDIVVGQDGKVLAAKPRKSSSLIDDLIYQYAQRAAERTLFNPDPSAPPAQSGNIKYTFIPQ
jgi:hypothetical protein